MGTIPTVKTPRFYEKKWTVEAIAIGPPIILAGIAAWSSWFDVTKRWQGWIYMVAVAWLGIASICKVAQAKTQDDVQKYNQGHDGLFGAVHTIYGAISTHKNFSEQHDERLRITVHTVVAANGQDSAPEELEQLLPYVGGQGGAVGRRFSIRSGIIGKAVREKAVFAFMRQNDDYEAFVNELVKDWAYTEKDARRLRSDRKSWMAIPIFESDTKTVIAVVYLDSSDRNLFDEEVKWLAMAGCSGIALYTNKRYK